MKNIKLEDLFFSDKENIKIIELLAKERNIKSYKSKSSDKLFKTLKKQSKNKKKNRCSAGLMSFFSFFP